MTLKSDGMLLLVILILALLFAGEPDLYDYILLDIFNHCGEIPHVSPTG